MHERHASSSSSSAVYRKRFEVSRAKPRGGPTSDAAENPVGGLVTELADDHPQFHGLAALTATRLVGVSRRLTGSGLLGIVAVAVAH